MAHTSTIDTTTSACFTGTMSNTPNPTPTVWMLVISSPEDEYHLAWTTEAAARKHMQDAFEDRTCYPNPQWLSDNQWEDEDTATGMFLTSVEVVA